MPADALAITLAAAVIHATWNALLGSSRDVQAATAVAAVLGAALFLPVAVATWDVGARAWPYLAGSVAAETAYLALLAAAYARAEVSVVYPVARGSAPVLVLLVAGATGVQALGVLAVALGVVAVRGLRAPEAWGDVGLALAVGACIATYTLLDKEGLRYADPLPYLEVDVGVASVLYAGALASRASWRPRLRAALGTRTALAGLGLFGSYGLILAALELARAPAVSAVRETSVVFAVAIAALFLGEKVSAVRAAGAIVVTAGVALVALG